MSAGKILKKTKRVTLRFSEFEIPLLKIIKEEARKDIPPKPSLNFTIKKLIKKGLGD